MVDTDKLIELGFEALQRAFKGHKELGERGLEPIQKNPHGETSLRGDIEAEKAVIETFRKANVPIRIISEEHGQTDITDNPQFLAVLDGLDGTNVYISTKGKGRYATMLGIFSNLNPDYNNYVFSGIMEHSTNSLFFALKGKGSFLLKDGEKTKIKCSSLKKLSKQTRIYADIGVDQAVSITLIHDTFVSKLPDYELVNVRSSAVGYADLANGKADLVLECTRKNNLEIAIAYGLINEAGGVMVTMDRVSVKDKKYLELGQKEHIPIVSASTIELANELIEEVNQS